MTEQEKDIIAKNESAVNDVKIEIVVALGSADLRVNQLLKLGRGAVVELDKFVNDDVEIFANDVLVGKGEVIVTENNMIGVNITEVVK
jgi:flagellar motor switch protein FliN/FliY